MTIRPITLSGLGVSDEAFSFNVPQRHAPQDTIPMSKVDFNRSIDTIAFMQELAAKQDELLVSMIKIMSSIKVEEAIDSAGAPGWAAVQEAMQKDYDNIVAFCQAGLDKLITEYPMEGEEDADTGTA